MDIPLKVTRAPTFFYVVGVAVVLLAFLVLRGYISVIVLAFITALFCRPVYDYFLAAFSGRPRLASLLTVILVFFVVLIPLSGMAGLAVQQIVQFSTDVGSGSIDLEGLVDRFNKFAAVVPASELHLSVPQLQQEVQRLSGTVGTYLLQRLPNIGSAAVSTLANIVLYLILLYSLLPLQDHFRRFVERLSPLDDRIDAVYITRVVEMSKSMMRGTLLIAIVQGVIGGICMAIVGVPYVLFWTLLMIVLGVIPMLGSGIVMVPASIILILNGQVWQGFFLFLVSILVISNVDNYLRPRLVSPKASMHPALVILGAVGGITAFGALGFLYGPVIMVLLVTTVEMYLKYFHAHRVGAVKTTE
ncbi:MAG: AI-2E family transporter [Patescibacteria group bacterium]